MKDFVHLHVHSHYSILEALGSVDEILDQVKDHGMDAVAITDKSNMFAAIEFYEAAGKAKIKPILGLEAWIDPKGIQDRSAGHDKVLYPVTLIAQNYQGYLNLIQLASKSRVEGYLPTPKIDKETLAAHAEGLICLTGDSTGELAQKLLAKDDQGAKDLLNWYKQTFSDRVYLELVPLKHTPDQLEANQALIHLGKETNTPLVLTANSYYTTADKAAAHDVMLAIKHKTTIANTSRHTLIHEDYSLKSGEEMASLAQELDIPEEALTNTRVIADSCDVEVPLFQIQLPAFEVPKRPDGTDQSDDDYLRQLCLEGIDIRYPEEKPEGLHERLDYELEVIKNSGYPSYFLIVQDFINWAKDQGILVGPGRGSAAGSLVSFLCGITDLDPLKFELLFERFLNPARVSMPDIDIDFQDNKRDLVLQYVAEKYGRDHVAQICTFGTMAAKASVRDTGRALGYSYTLCDSISKLIEEKTIAKSLDASSELKARYEQDDKVKTLIDMAQILEGSVRHTSTHACAVVISNKELTAYTPLQISESGGKTGITTQYEMHGIEDLGLLKMDFLGLANLSIIGSTLKLIKDHHGREIDMSRVPLDDKGAYQLFQKGQTTGVFQFESQGMKKALMGLKPSEFDDLIAMVSLYRPGPMELIPTYIARKHGKEEVKYLHPNLEKILAPTYGIMIYQEQLMQASQALAGFTLPEADILRKAVGKKILELMEEQKIKIIEGTVAQGIDRSIGEKLWELIEPFGNYGFNKSHAACYALVAYQTAYLKAHYPIEFMVSLMNSDAKDLTRIQIEIDESRQLGLEVLPPSINTSQPVFSGTGKKIVYGLGSIRNFSEKLAEIIVAEREANGKFASLQDFMDHIDPKELNKKNLEALVKSGALDEFEPRHVLIHNLELLLEYLKKRAHLEKENAAQASLFGGGDTGPSLPPLQLERQIVDERQAFLENLELEATYLGCFVSGHPIDEFQAKIDELSLPDIKETKTIKRITGITLTGLVSSIKEITTKKGAKMAFLEVEDTQDRIEVVIFPSTFQALSELLRQGACLVVKGKFDKKDNQIKLIAQDIKEITDPTLIEWLGKKPPKRVKRASVDDLSSVGDQSEDTGPLRNFTPDGEEVSGINILIPKGTKKQVLHDLKEVLTRTPPGPCSVHLLINPHSYDTQCVDTTFSVQYSPELIATLKTIVNPYAENPE